MSKRLGLLALALTVSGCVGFFDKNHQGPVTCKSDLECGAGEVCFVDGCGDPGKDIAVEITPSARNGAYPQDFAIDNLRASQAFQLYAPSQIQGAVQRDQDTGGTVAYPGTVSVVLNGESTLIPGLARHFEATVPQGQGSYAVPVGSGVYAISATPDDPSLPPLFDPGRQITPGSSETIDLVFPKTSDLAALSGTLVKVAGTPLVEPVQIQAFDTDGHPLSQTAAVAASGAFTLSVARSTLSLGTVNLRVSPVDPAALLPTKTFAVTPTAALGNLELGDFGAPFAVSGVVTDAHGAAIVGASVHVEGGVVGGGTFQSQVVQTAADGSFALQTLGIAGGSKLYVVPTADSASGILVTDVALTQQIKLAALVCPDKIPILGSVLTPDGTPAVGVTVTAVPLSALDPNDPSHPLPPNGGETTTDTAGNFQLALDPAQYRLDFTPTTKLPRLSRFLQVSADQEASGQISVPAFTLSHGRSATGHVEVLPADGGTPDVAALARVRFYRRVDNGDTPSSVLLDQAYADETGNFTVLLPTR